MLRASHNYTGYGEVLVFLQVISYLVILYLESKILTKSVVAYLMDEYFSSNVAWLGCLLVASTIFIEKALFDMIDLMKTIQSSDSAKYVSFTNEDVYEKQKDASKVSNSGLNNSEIY